MCKKTVKSKILGTIYYITLWLESFKKQISQVLSLFTFFFEHLLQIDFPQTLLFLLSEKTNFCQKYQLCRISKLNPLNLILQILQTSEIENWFSFLRIKLGKYKLFESFLSKTPFFKFKNQKVPFWMGFFKIWIKDRPF